MAGIFLGSGIEAASFGGGPRFICFSGARIGATNESRRLRRGRRPPP